MHMDVAAILQRAKSYALYRYSFWLSRRLQWVDGIGTASYCLVHSPGFVRYSTNDGCGGLQ